MLQYTDLTGRRIDKVQTAIDRIRAFCPPEGYYLAFSGGKDSVCIKALADMAGAKYDAHYGATTVDPPELVRFIMAEYPDVAIEKPEIPMIKLIPKNLMPPTRITRYCCAYYKERGGDGRVTMTGTRWAESQNRKNNQGMATIINGSKARTVAEQNGAEYFKTKRGIVLNFDNDAARRTVESCYRTNKTLVNPIIDWLDDDVWEFIRLYHIRYCPLYDEGWKRLGCVGCPMSGPENMEREFRRWPAIEKIYLKAFAGMLEERERRGVETRLWKSPDDVMRWWLKKSGDKQIDGQMSVFDDEPDEEGDG